MNTAIAISLDQRAERIRELVSTARKAIIEIGWELCAAKNEMPHGAWLPWLESNFGWSERSAQNYMKVAIAFRPFLKSATVADLKSLGNLDSLAIDARALYFLSGKSVPEEVRAEAVKLAKTEPVTLAIAKKLHGGKGKPKPEPSHAMKIVTTSQPYEMARADDGGLKVVPAGPPAVVEGDPRGGCPVTAEDAERLQGRTIVPALERCREALGKLQGYDLRRELEAGLDWHSTEQLVTEVYLRLNSLRFFFRKHTSQDLRHELEQKARAKESRALAARLQESPPNG